MSALVAGIDSSTQSCKVVIRDASTGTLVRSGRAAHPDGTEVHPQHWWSALLAAIEDAGGLDDVAAVSVAGQQHGMVVLDADGEVIRDALLWNDTRSAPQADTLTGAGTSAQAWAEAVGSVPVASFTVTKLAWLAEHEPDAAARVAAVCLPHDWLTWKLSGSTDLADLVTDRGDASGTGYFSPATGEYRRELLVQALGEQVGNAVVLPRVLAPQEVAGRVGAQGVSGQPLSPRGALLAPGTGDNMAAALALEARVGDVVVSIGTSGVVSAVSAEPAADASGLVAGFADATGNYLPLACTLNAARVLDATARMLGVDHDQLSALALQAPPGSGGLVLVPYLEGERTPNRPDATGSLYGLTLTTAQPAYLARAAVEGLLCGLADGLDALVAQGVSPQRVLLVGGGAKSQALREIAPAVLGYPVIVPPSGEYVADGAARQAAWVLSGTEAPPAWAQAGAVTMTAEATPGVRERYAAVRDLT